MVTNTVNTDQNLSNDKPILKRTDSDYNYDEIELSILNCISLAERSDRLISGLVEGAQRLDSEEFEIMFGIVGSHTNPVYLTLIVSGCRETGVPLLVIPEDGNLSKQMDSYLKKKSTPLCVFVKRPETMNEEETLVNKFLSRATEHAQFPLAIPGT